MGTTRRAMPLAEARSVQTAINHLSDHRESVAAQQAQITNIYGHTSVSGPGEAAYDVFFPVLFVEKPVFQPGLEFEVAAAVPGSYPRWSATINGWIMTPPDPAPVGTIQYWTGAHLVVSIVAPVVAAPAGAFIVHHQFIGRAMRKVP